MDDLIHIVARDDHTELFLSDGRSHLDATRMEHWERRLPPSFLRTHRSHIVNLRAALSLARRPGGWVVHTPLAAPVPVGRSRLTAVRAALRAATSGGAGALEMGGGRRLG